MGVHGLGSPGVFRRPTGDVIKAMMMEVLGPQSTSDVIRVMRAMIVHGGVAVFFRWTSVSPALNCLLVWTSVGGVAVFSRWTSSVPPGLNCCWCL